jgi:hypothetical protein
MGNECMRLDPGEVGTLLAGKVLADKTKKKRPTYRGWALPRLQKTPIYQDDRGEMPHSRFSLALV